MVLPTFSTFTHQLKKENDREDNIYFSDLLNVDREGIAKAELIWFSDLLNINTEGIAKAKADLISCRKSQNINCNICF